jgi:uncharacterized membrane protein YkoI
MGRLTALALIAVITSLSLAPAPAGASEGHEKAKRLKNAGEILPLESVINAATSEKPGRVIEAELKKSRAGYVYEIELVDKSGVVWELVYDAKTGDIVSSKIED